MHAGRLNRGYDSPMKRMMMVHPDKPAITRAAAAPITPQGAAWNGLTLPDVPTADWPASVVLEQAIDRVARDAISSGRSLQEAVARITELTQSLMPQVSEAEIDKRIHAQMMAHS